MFVVVEVGFLQTRSARVQSLTASSVGNLGRRPPRTTSSRVSKVLGRTGSLLVSSSSRSRSRPPLPSLLALGPAGSRDGGVEGELGLAA